jgi:hypothetical protein
MNPPNIYELTIPNSHIVNGIAKIVQGISSSVLYQLRILIRTVKKICKI